MKSLGLFRRRSRRKLPRRFIETQHVKENPFFTRGTSENVASSKAFVSIGMLVVLFGLIYLLSFDRSFELTASISGVRRSDPELIAREVQRILNSRIWGIVKRDKYITVSNRYFSEELQKRIQGTFALERIEVQKRFPDKISITIQEREPSLLWETRGAVYSMDDEGIIVQELSPEQAEASPYPRLKDNNNFPVEIGETVIIPDTPKSVVTMHAKLAELNYPAQEYQIPKVSCEILRTAREGDSAPVDASPGEDGTAGSDRAPSEHTEDGNTNTTPAFGNEPDCNERELARNTKTIYAQTDNFELRFSSSNLDEQIAKLERLVSEEFFRGKTLRYVDIRFGERVYYK